MSWMDGSIYCLRCRMCCTRLRCRRTWRREGLAAARAQQRIRLSRKIWEVNMRMRIVALVCAVTLGSVGATTSPDTREITDPKKITSVEADGAGAVPIDDLFYTRATAGGAWSPDGKEIVFSSNFSGRLNLWKVGAAGGWPVQLSQSDDRQVSALWSPDGKWILY